MKTSIWIIFAISLLTVPFLSTCDIWGIPNNPLDPKSSNYQGNAKAFTSFSIVSPVAEGIISESAKTITITVPNGTSVTNLVTVFTVSGANVKIGTTTQVSGVTTNDFTSPKTYIVTAQDGSTASYIVTVIIAPAAAKAITAFLFINPPASGTITESTKSISITIPYGTAVTSLVASFISTGASVKVGSTLQVSGITPNDFTNPVHYVVTAADNTTATYTITVVIAGASDKAITSFSFPSLSINASINETLKTISATVPFETNVSALVANFNTSGETVKVGTVLQVSGTTPNDFTNPVSYKVTAEDTTTAIYIVTVVVAADSAKAITSFSFESLSVTGTINESAKTISATVPYGTNVKALVATFGTTGISVKVGSLVQSSGVTANNFTAAVNYIVTASDTSTATYTVTVAIALSSAKAITMFSFPSLSVVGTIDEGAKTITAIVPYNTNITALVASFDTTGASVKVGSTVQSSGVTANNFTSIVIFVVTASDNSTATYVVIVTVLPLVVKSVSSGGLYTMILKSDGTLWATGNNSSSQLGVGNTTDKVTPVQVMTSVSSVSAGVGHTMILKTDGTLWATGYNQYGQLGDGTTTDKLIPVQVMSGMPSVSAGGYHTMILKADETLWAVGYNNFGQLGDGTTTYKLVPVQVMSGVSSVYAGENHTMILKTDGTLWATGLNEKGQLGDGTTTDKLSPVQVMTGVSSVSVGSVFTMILKTDGTLWATGRNVYGEFGDGTTTDKLIPIQVLSGVSSVSTGIVHTMILKTDGTLWATGYNEYGQLGISTYPNTLNPVQVMSGVSYVSAGRWHTMILKTDGTLWATGFNLYGQLGDGTYINKHTPVLIF